MRTFASNWSIGVVDACDAWAVSPPVHVEWEAQRLAKRRGAILRTEWRVRWSFGFGRSLQQHHRKVVLETATSAEAPASWSSAITDQPRAPLEIATRRSQPTYFHTPSDIASTRHGSLTAAAKETATAAPQPTGGFFCCPAVSSVALPPLTRSAAESPAGGADHPASINAQAYQRGEPRDGVCCDSGIRLTNDARPCRRINQSLRSAGESAAQSRLAGELGRRPAPRLSALAIGHQAHPAIGGERMRLNAECILVHAMTTHRRVRLDTNHWLVSSGRTSDYPAANWRTRSRFLNRTSPLDCSQTDLWQGKTTYARRAVRSPAIRGVPVVNAGSGGRR